jgi:predicted Zn-dependent protease
MHWKTYRIVPNQQTQEYIAKVGESFIPAHQKDLPADDPLKIPFCFYLVEARNFNAVSHPNEGVVVNSGVFDVLQNEAQLAFVLSHEISHAVERHAWEAHQYDRTELMALRVGGAFVPHGGSLMTKLFASGIQSQYALSLSQQAAAQSCNISRSPHVAAAFRCTRHRYAPHESIPVQSAVVRPNS